jgi:5S rRNA maturation endonuclease (ribonuclease M5)
MMPPLHAIAKALGGEVIDNKYVKAPGPGHSAEDRSMTVTLEEAAPDGFLVHSFAGDDALGCKDYVRKKLGLEKFKAKKKSNPKPYSQTITRHTYRLADGTPYLQVHRIAAKDFFQHHWDGEKWMTGAPKGPKVPYLLPELLKAPLTAPVYIVEGEKDADNLAKLGFVATCNSEGADNGKGGKWTPELNEFFRDRHVYILPDNDHVGRTHAQHVARSLDKIAASIRVVSFTEDLKPKDDVSDWLEQDPTGAKLVKKCKAAPIWEPMAQHSESSDKEFIDELAELTPLEYAKRRKGAAEQIGISVGELDKIVSKARREVDDDGEDGRGRPVKISDPLPWTEPVTGNEIATKLRTAFKTFSVIPDVVADTIALWTLHTWTVNEFSITPRLAITSPTKGCGKTTILKLLAKLVRRPKRAGSISPSALFRVVEMFQPCLLMDETEKYIEHGSDLHALLCEGHAKGGAVLRVLGEKLELREFAVYAPVAFARNGKMPDDLEQRSINIPMKRRRRDEPMARLKDDKSEGEAFDGAARMCARWAGDYATAVRDCDPDMGDQINRVSDNWRPLYAIADVIGEEWPQRIREAAAALTPRDSETTGVLLLGDIKKIFDDRGDDRLWSQSICDALVAMEGRPWAEWKASNAAEPGPLTKNQLARLLKPFGIAPETIRIGEDRAKGYYRHVFSEAWERYLPEAGGFESLRRDKCDEIRTSGTFRNVTSESNVTVPKFEKSNNGGICHGVTVEKGVEGQVAGNGRDPPLGLSPRAVRQPSNCRIGLTNIAIPIPGTSIRP